MTAPDQCCSNVRKFLPRRRPHMTQSGHERLGLLPRKLARKPHFTSRKSLL
jgi:hypothetical protein